MLLHRVLKFRLLTAVATGFHGPIRLGNVRKFAAQLPARLVIPEEEIEESFLKGSGPGGQKIHLPTGMVVKSQATRSRSQNRSVARRLLADKLEDVEKGAESRTALKTEIKRKKKASKMKKARRKHRSSAEDRDLETAASDQTTRASKDEASSGYGNAER
ncbi:MAG: hypothetical protein Q9188_003059 [Gyalolechia gomerana]